MEYDAGSDEFGVTAFTGTEIVDRGPDPVIIPAGSKFHVLATQFAEEVATDPRVSGSARGSSSRPRRGGPTCPWPGAPRGRKP